MVIAFVSICDNWTTAKNSPQINGRWSAFRQGVIEATRALVTSSGSSYSIPDVNSPDRPAAAHNLLSGDKYHFGKTVGVSTFQRHRHVSLPEPRSLISPQGAIDTAAPYQHPEIFAALAYFFKGRESVAVMYGDRIPNGIHGAQIPDAMVALIATAVSASFGPSVTDAGSLTSCGKIQVTLEELVQGRSSQFSEKSCREKYRIHLTTIRDVKTTDDGDRKYARLMSNIYQGTMCVPHHS